ncbi:MAG: hypothetical protein JO101_08455 [Candidatus Eremiobacteraeota bacterium]|nr:hypothetical protein [Candidatus Eremiobacteraeota bacterium]MBV8355335.1 hypothetical protein [Candidatus Eremiobacteraeota bacterium]
MADFVPLFERLRTQSPAPNVSPLIAELPGEATPPEPSDRLAEMRHAEALERALRALLREIAAEVLGRELMLAPCEIDAIVARLCRRYALERAQVRVSASDGDIALECESGWIDASLGRRLEAALERCALERCALER